MSPIETKIIAIIQEKLGIQEEEIFPDSHFVNDFGFDSLDLAELTIELEKTFDITISDEKATQIQTVKQVIEVIKEELNS